ncbi:MAG: methyltransferase domain-containing protein, partial [Chloroflexi bacterium]|nr:methyltransferase domain-containing protein [Chloroflexota bacterium]
MSGPNPNTRSRHFGAQLTAETYERIMLPRIFEPWARVLLAQAVPNPGDAVLDAATGPGTVAYLAAGMVGAAGRVVGVDISAAMLQVARQ